MGIKIPREINIPNIRAERKPGAELVGARA